MMVMMMMIRSTYVLGSVCIFVHMYKYVQWVLYKLIPRIYDTIWYDIFNCNWVDTRWQWNSTHLHTQTIHRIQRWNIHNIKKINSITIKKLTNLASAGRVPSLTSYTLAFALQLRKKHGKPSVRVASRTSQTDAVQYTNNEQYKTQKKIVTQSITMSQNNKEHRIHNREDSSYQVSKPCVKLVWVLYLTGTNEHYVGLTSRLSIKRKHETLSLVSQKHTDEKTKHGL
jgi:hypothetical protein